jgi:hypothetical protein
MTDIQNRRGPGDGYVAIKGLRSGSNPMLGSSTESWDRYSDTNTKAMWALVKIDIN